jgi:hypothetical protein
MCWRPSRQPISRQAALAALPIDDKADLPPDASVAAGQARHSPAVEVKGAASEAALSRTQAVIEQQIKDDKKQRHQG